MMVQELQISGSKRRVAKKIMNEELHAHYMHFFAHALNLAVQEEEYVLQESLIG